MAEVTQAEREAADFAAAIEEAENACQFVAAQPKRIVQIAGGK